MILIAIGTLTLLMSLAVFWRRAVEMRANRWRLYALRDELRRQAFEDRDLLSSNVFRTLDARLTAYCAYLDELSLWAILPTVLFSDRQKIEGRQRDFITRLHQPQHAKLVPIYEESRRVLAQQLVWRHMFLASLGFVTVVGIFFCHVSTRWLSERILSGAVKPIAEPALCEIAA